MDDFEPNNIYIRLMLYNWQQEDWPVFTYELEKLEESLLQFVEAHGQIQGMINALPEGERSASIIDFMVSEALKTSAIEGEYLSREDVLSSIRNNLGLNRYPEKIKDKRAEGVARLMVVAREKYDEALSEKMLFEWHSMMMEPYIHINIGQWRRGEEPMQIISGSIGREVIHFLAPPSSRVPREMKQFFDWFNSGPFKNEKKIFLAPVRSAIAHLYFESIHPFEDGNGRIGRAISEKVLSQDTGQPILLSLSLVIESERQAYYDALKAGQRSNEITKWIAYFIQSILKAQQLVIQSIDFTIKKSQFFDSIKTKLNARQEKVLNRMLEAGPSGFEGGMSAKKYSSIVKCSKATATRDLQVLAKIGALVVRGGGRSTRYELKL